MHVQDQGPSIESVLLLKDASGEGRGTAVDWAEDLTGEAPRRFYGSLRRGELDPLARRSKGLRLKGRKRKRPSRLV